LVFLSTFHEFHMNALYLIYLVECNRAGNLHWEKFDFSKLNLVILFRWTIKDQSTFNIRYCVLSITRSSLATIIHITHDTECIPHKIVMWTSTRKCLNRILTIGKIWRILSESNEYLQISLELHFTLNLIIFTESAL